tara:strand:- start:788 stop:1669 length:882 start_codon:yes stop_codon:yes gene_type:complete
MQSSKKVLIFGIDSFTGPFLKDTLQDSGLEVVGTTISSNSISDHSCDITSFEDCCSVIQKVNPSYIVNLAGISYVPHGKVQDIYRVNHLGVVNILEAINSLDITPKLVLISSAQIYNAFEGVEISEHNKLNPQSHYACSKWMMEKSAQLYIDSLDICIARPFNYTGLGQSEKFVVPKIVQHFKSKESVIELGDISVRRDFSDVRDVVNAYKTLLLDKDAKGVYNICSNTDVSISSIIDFLKNESGHNIKVNVNTDFIRKNDLKVLKGDNRKLKSLNWTANNSFKDTLLWMINS